MLHSISSSFGGRTCKRICIIINEQNKLSTNMTLFDGGHEWFPPKNDPIHSKLRPTFHATCLEGYSIKLNLQLVYLLFSFSFLLFFFLPIQQKLMAFHASCVKCTPTEKLNLITINITQAPCVYGHSKCLQHDFHKCHSWSPKKSNQNKTFEKKKKLKNVWSNDLKVDLWRVM